MSLTDCGWKCSCGVEAPKGGTKAALGHVKTAHPITGGKFQITLK